MSAPKKPMSPGWAIFWLVLGLAMIFGLIINAVNPPDDSPPPPSTKPTLVRVHTPTADERARCVGAAADSVARFKAQGRTVSFGDEFDACIMLVSGGMGAVVIGK